MLKKYFALSEQGASDLKKGIVSSVFVVLSLMLPIGILVMYLMQQLVPLLGGETTSYGLDSYVVLCVPLLILIFATHYIQYKCTYVSAYEESARRRIQLAEKLRTLPLSFFNKRDLSDLTTTIMTDCSDLERILSYTLPQLFGTSIVLAVVCCALFFIDWRMALAIAWVLPTALLVLFAGKKLQDRFNRKKIASKLTVSAGIQEYLESIRDLKANNQTENYLGGLERKLDQAVSSSIRYELVTDTLLACAQMILRLGFATTVLVGATLLLRDELSLLMYLMFLLMCDKEVIEV